MANAISGTKTFPILKAYGTVLKGNIVNGSNAFPGFKVAAVVIQGSYAYLESPLPKIINVAEGGGEVIVEIPALCITTSAQIDTIAHVTASLPSFKLTSLALVEGKATLSASIPALRLSSSAIPSGIAFFTSNLPMVRLTSSAINGLLTSVALSIPSLRLRSTSYSMAGATIDVGIPLIRINSRAVSSNIIALVMNTKNFALTEYSNYCYNGLGFFNGKMVGAKPSGIFELTGSDDNGENIEWNFKTGKLDMDTDLVKKARHAWLSYKPSGDLLLTVDDGEHEYEYNVESVKVIDNAVRVKLGKGIRNRYLQFELSNVAGETIKLDRMRIFSEVTARKR
jgi:hypothetical protein